MADETAPPHDLEGKTIVVTGATRGIGSALTHDLLARGAKVYCVVRDAERASALKDEWFRLTHNPECLVVGADLADMGQVRVAAEEIGAKEESLYALVHNAGAWPTTRRETVDGFETTIAVNHLAPFLLTHLLVDRLVAGAPARIVSVSSAVHTRGAIHLDDLQLEKSFSGRAAYCQSKLANVLFVRELAARLADKGVTANAVHPGVVKTDLGREIPRIIRAAVRLFSVSPEDGAAPLVRLVTDPELANVSGKYFHRFEQREPARQALDEDMQRKLWDLSCELLGLAPDAI